MPELCLGKMSDGFFVTNKANFQTQLFEFREHSPVGELNT